MQKYISRKETSLKFKIYLGVGLSVSCLHNDNGRYILMGDINKFWVHHCHCQAPFRQLLRFWIAFCFICYLPDPNLTSLFIVQCQSKLTELVTKINNANIFLPRKWSYSKLNLTFHWQYYLTLTWPWLGDWAQLITTHISGSSLKFINFTDTELTGVERWPWAWLCNVSFYCLSFNGLKYRSPLKTQTFPFLWITCPNCKLWLRFLLAQLTLSVHDAVRPF